MARIRQAVHADLPQLTEIYNYYVINTPATFDINPYTSSERQVWFDQFNQHPRHRLLVLADVDKVLGYASSQQLRIKPAYAQSIETTIYLANDQRGAGFGEMLYTALLSELILAGTHRCYGVITLPNDASIALHEKLGFRKVAHLTEVGFKFDRYWDTVWMEKSP